MCAIVVKLKFPINIDVISKINFMEMPLPCYRLSESTSMV